MGSFEHALSPSEFVAMANEKIDLKTQKRNGALGLFL